MYSIPNSRTIETQAATPGQAVAHGAGRVGWGWLVRFGSGLFCLSMLNGCAIGFLWHVSVGQLKLMARQQPVDEVLRDVALSEEQAAKLRLIVDVRRFAMQELGLDADDSYTTFVDVGGPYVTYNVSAAPKTALQPYVWWFPTRRLPTASRILVCRCCGWIPRCQRSGRTSPETSTDACFRKTWPM